MFMTLLKARKRSQFGVSCLEKKEKKKLTPAPRVARGTFKNLSNI
jgi:hypothetical protein